MTVLTATDRDALARAFAGDARIVVVSMCAAWCDTCNEFRVAYERIARLRPECAFVWLDIEDDAAIAGDIDVENFPTLAVFRGDVPVHFGVTTPQEATLARLIDELASRTVSARDVPEEVRALAGALRGARVRRT